MIERREESLLGLGQRLTQIAGGQDKAGFVCPETFHHRVIAFHGPHNLTNENLIRRARKGKAAIAPSFRGDKTLSGQVGCDFGQVVFRQPEDRRNL